VVRVARSSRVPGEPRTSSGGIAIIRVSCWNMNTENRAYPKFSTARPVTAARATQPSRKLTVRHTGQPRPRTHIRIAPAR
jgi:hypothetical protein